MNTSYYNEIINREKDLTSYFSSFQHKTANVAHIRFLNFEKYGHPKPIYISTIRDPIARMQSHYNYDTFADRAFYISYKKYIHGENIKKPNFVQCVRRFIQEGIKASDLRYGTDSTIKDTNVSMALKRIPSSYTCFRKKYINIQLRYYCGYAEVCKTLQSNNQETLKLALHNLKSQFHVVMVIENMMKSIQVAEKIIPTFFKGAISIYEERSLHSNANIKSKIFKSEVPSDVRSYLSELLESEIVLYEAAKKRLQYNIEKCNIK
jgi:hypothetical protein